MSRRATATGSRQRPPTPGCRRSESRGWARANTGVRCSECKFAASFIVLTRDARSGRVRITSAGEPYFDYRLGAREKSLLKAGMANVARIHFAAGAERIMTLHSTGLAWDRAVDGATIEKFCRRIASAPTSPNRLPLFSAHRWERAAWVLTPPAQCVTRDGASVRLERRLRRGR